MNNMNNMDVNELILWVQKTVGGAINEIIAAPNISFYQWYDQSVRENFYMEATRFMLNDAPVSIDIKKECVIQTLGRLQAAVKMRTKYSEVSALSNKVLYWGQDEARDFYQKSTDPAEIQKMLNNELSCISNAFKYAENLFTDPITVKERLEKSRNDSQSVSKNPHKA